MLALAHGIQGDFNKATSEFPTGPDGQEVELRPFKKQAKKLAKQLADLLKRCVATRATQAA
jgi:hypothetical protein